MTDEPTTAPNPEVLATPPMVRPAVEAVGDLPAHTGPRRVLGVKAGGRKGDFYFVASSSQFAGRRYARRFPLDQEGWEAAWHAFATEDPAGARAYLDRRAALASGNGSRAAIPLDTVGGTPIYNRQSPLPMDDPGWTMPLGWSYLVGGFFFMVVGIVLVHAGASWHNSGLIVFAFITLSFGLLLGLIGVVAEGIRVSSQQREREQNP